MSLPRIPAICDQDLLIGIADMMAGSGQGPLSANWTVSWSRHPSDTVQWHRCAVSRNRSERLWDEVLLHWVEDLCAVGDLGLGQRWFGSVG